MDSQEVVILLFLLVLLLLIIHSWRGRDWGRHANGEGIKLARVKKISQTGVVEHFIPIGSD